MRKLTFCFALIVLAPWPAAFAFASSPIQIESGGHKYIVDADSEEFQRRMTAANSGTQTGGLPSWLYPSPDATPSRPVEALSANHVIVWFQVGGTAEQFLAYYSQLLASRGWRLSASSKNSVAAASASESVSVITSSIRGPLRLRITYMSKHQAAARRKLKPAWYDDNRALLCVRDASTGEEFFVTRDVVIELSGGRQEKASQGCEPPVWYPVFPGSQAVGPGEVKSFFKSSRVYVTHAAIRQVYDFYKQSFENAGAKITSSHFSSSGMPPHDVSGMLVAQMGDERISVNLSSVVYLGSGFGETPHKGQTGIAVGCR